MRQSVGRCVTALVAGALFLAMVGGSGAAAAGSAFVAIDLGALGGNASVAGALNDSGQVAGRIVYAGGYAHAFSWTQSGGMIDLGTLGGSNSSIGSNNIYGDPHALNDAGQIVGSSTTANGATHAFSWTPSGGMIDLGTLGGNYSLAEQRERRRPGRRLEHDCERRHARVRVDAGRRHGRPRHPRRKQ